VIIVRRKQTNSHCYLNENGLKGDFKEEDNI